MSIINHLNTYLNSTNFSLSHSLSFFLFLQIRLTTEYFIKSIEICLKVIS